MKPTSKISVSSSLFGCIVLSATCLLPGIACAIEWSGTTGPFGTAANWAGGVVPADTTASILNSGMATITTGDAFSVTQLFVGGHAGIGTVDQDAGSIAVTQLVIGGDDGAAGTGKGTYNISGGTLTGANGEMWVGSKGGEGIFNVGGGAVVSNNNWIVIGRDGAKGDVVVSGTAELKTTAQNIGIGVFSPGKMSTVTVKDSAKLTSANELYVGWGANNTNEGTLTVQDSSTVTVAAGLVVGRDSGKGMMTVSQSATVNVNGFLVVGADATGNGTMTMKDSSSIQVARGLWIGQNNGTGVLNLDGGTLVSHPVLTGPGGTVDSTGSSVTFRGASGTLNLNGGVIETTGFNRTTGTAKISFNGSQIKTTGTIEGQSFFNSFDSENLVIESGGLKLDTNSFTVSVYQSIGGTGSLTKSGEGSLVIYAPPAYTGETVISKGTLAFYLEGFADSSTVRIAQDAKLELLHEGVDVVSRLYIGNVQQPAGTYVSADSGLPGTQLSQLSGTGSLEVTSNPGMNTYESWLSANAPATGFSPDTDHDGIPNGLENVLGTNPNIASAGLTAVSKTESGATFNHTLNPDLASDVTYGYEWSTDLVEWKASGVANSGGTNATITASAPVSGVVTVTIAVATGPNTKVFGRLVAKKAP